MNAAPVSTSTKETFWTIVATDPFGQHHVFQESGRWRKLSDDAGNHVPGMSEGRRWEDESEATAFARELAATWNETWSASIQLCRTIRHSIPTDQKDALRDSPHPLDRMLAGQAVRAGDLGQAIAIEREKTQIVCACGRGRVIGPRADVEASAKVGAVRCRHCGARFVWSDGQARWQP
jgi:hypothetical protein